MGIRVVIVLVAGLALLAAMVAWNDWHPARRREVDFYDSIDEPDALAERRTP